VFSGVHANKIHVPKQFKTIQEGINAAVDGDVVLVDHGTYFENINFLGKKITVASYFYLDHKKQHIKKTIINGSKPADPNFGSVVSFVSGEDTNSVLSGFTITEGAGTLFLLPDTPPMRVGGGIICWASGATISNNIIVQNSLSGAPWTMGGGIEITPPFLPIYAIVKNNVIEHNSISGEQRVNGGGMDFSASGKIINNIISGNEAIASVESPAGGGLSLQSWDPAVVPPNDVLVSGNTITKNKALQLDDATYWLGGIGAGIWVIGSKGVLANNIISDNEVSGALSTYGAGVVLDYPPDDLTFKNNIVSDNYFSGSAPCYGGGLAIWDGNPSLENNLFLNNRGSYGGAVWLGYDFCFSKLINNTFSENYAAVQGGAINTFNSHPVLMNSILWDNYAPVDAELCLESGEIDVSFCDIAGGWEGEGNKDKDPLFMGKTYLLAPASPCVDAGCSEEIYNDPENPKHTGFAMRPSRGTLRNDMGAFGGPDAANWKMDFKSFNPSPIVAKQFKAKMHCFPNPFNSQTTIEFDLDETDNVSLKIYNALGQEMATLVNRKLEPGHLVFTWDAQKAATGLYFIKFKTGSAELTEKLMLVK